MDFNYFFIIWFLLTLLLIFIEFLTKLKQFAFSKWIGDFLLYGKEKKLHDQETKETVRPNLINSLVNLQMPKR